MYIPDCRRDDDYNQKYLDQHDADYVMGFDYCAEQIGTFFDNISIYADCIDEANDGDIDICRYLEKHPNVAAALAESIEDWVESQRDDLITSMIDSMDEEEYTKAKEEVDSGVRKPYIKILNKETMEYVEPHEDIV